MTDTPDLRDDGTRLAPNIVHFCRVLRTAGLPIGPGQVLAALEAVATVGIGTRRDFYWTLHAALITRHDQREVFDQAFHMFWRDPDLLMRAMNLFMPQLEGEADADQRDINRRVAEAMAPERRPGEGESPEDAKPPEIEIDARLTFSDKEVLQSRDFEQMSADEIAKAKRIIAAMRLPVHDLPTRRFLPDPTGPRVDGRRTLRRSMRGGGDTIELARKRRETRPPALVVLCDISGSMSQYSRMLLHFLHAVSTDRDRVHSFLFGTRLTNITRQLRDKDVDVALAKVGETVGDWSGGTRIGACLDAFNRHWSRRVLGQGAVVLLITDGLERDDTEILAPAMDRLHRSCRRLIWLNPLLRYDAYAPKSQGARAMIGHVDEVRAAHNLDSLAGLAAALDSHFHPDRAEMRRWRALAA
ncbi:MAG: VWA domain-containing protein [Rhodospirillaceae bacterium]|nr:VWA domain-containing protein [Rhodospirillaceae bacterium]